MVVVGSISVYSIVHLRGGSNTQDSADYVHPVGASKELASSAKACSARSRGGSIAMRLLAFPFMLLSATSTATAAYASLPAPIDLSSGSSSDLHACGRDSACWTASSDDGDGATSDGRGAVRVPAFVPGEIHDDLMRNGVVKDIWYGNGSTLADASWVGWRTWRFSREFDSPARAGPQSGSRWRHWLRFEGVQYNCTVKLNSVILGHHIGQFEPFEYDVTELLHPAASGQANQLEVITHPLLDNATEFERQVATKSSDQRDYTGQVSCWLNRHAPQWMGRTFYGWDFVPAVYSAGISNQVSLHTTASLLAGELASPPPQGAPPAVLRAQALSIIPRLSPPYDSARLELSLEVHLYGSAWAGHTSGLTVSFQIFAPTGATSPVAALTTVFNVSATAGQVQFLRTNLTVSEPALWYPNGYGAQPIYNATAVVSGAASGSDLTELDSISETFGIRELTVTTNPHIATGWSYTQYGPEHTETQPWGWGSWQATVAPPIPPNATRWQIHINGLPVFARGGNWIPRDQLFGRGVRERSRTTKVLLAAKHAGFTWMRVWGGGLLEDQHFYRECDRLGLMLLQEFPHAGCSPGGPGDSFPNITARLPLDDAQTRMALKQLINHPSIVR